MNDSIMVTEQEIINALAAPQSKSKFLTFSGQRAMIAFWMLGMSFGAAGFIWYGISAWEDPFQSIANIALGIWIILISVMRIVQKELENGSKK
jgi:hypothetical protein